MHETSSLLGGWPSAGPKIALVAFPALILFAAVVVFTRAEDEALERVFGDEYRAYRARVPGFMPRLPAVLPRVSRT